MPGEFADRFRGDACLTGDVSRLSVDTIAGWLTNEAYWAVGRSREAIERSIVGSHLYGVVSPDGATVACVRVVTDGATMAWLCDVFVAESHRGRGIGTWMVGEVTDFWAAAGVARLLLGTRDAHEVYARVGYAPLTHPERFMEIDRRPSF